MASPLGRGTPTANPYRKGEQREGVQSQAQKGRMPIGRNKGRIIGASKQRTVMARAKTPKPPRKSGV